MSPVQSSIFSIIENIAVQYNTITELKNDKLFLTWSKHVKSKTLLNSYLNAKFYQRKINKAEKELNLPKYF